MELSVLPGGRRGRRGGGQRRRGAQSARRRLRVGGRCRLGRLGHVAGRRLARLLPADARRDAPVQPACAQIGAASPLRGLSGPDPLPVSLRLFFLVSAQQLPDADCVGSSMTSRLVSSRLVVASREEEAPSDGRMAVSLDIGGRRFRGVGPNKRTAKCAAAKFALRFQPPTDKTTDADVE